MTVVLKMTAALKWRPPVCTMGSLAEGDRAQTVEDGVPNVADEILIVDDQAEVLEHLSKHLSGRGFEVHRAQDCEAARKVFVARKGQLSLVVLDLDLGAGKPSGFTLLEEFKKERPELPVIILTGKGGVREAVKAMKLGAEDFLEKDLYLSEHLEQSVAKVRKLMEVLEAYRKLEARTEELERTADYYGGLVRNKYQMVGQSRAMQELRAKITALVDIPRPVLIRGERGTGKELVAAQIHYRSGRRASRPFVVVNSAAFSGSLLESEMFGHEKGAFTGADRQRIGRFEQANGGTLFLDEIGNMSVEFQEKILRVIEYQRFERVQGSETIEVDVRVVAATNADLETLMSGGRFRADLYDRLTFQTVHVPALRERREDIPLLVEHFLERLRREVPGAAVREFSKGALEKLADYDWPGNVRQLRNAVERTAVFLDVEVVEPEHIELEPMGVGRRSGTFAEQVQRFEEALVTDALRRCGYHQKKAADALGLTYDQFRHYYRKFGLAEL